MLVVVAASILVADDDLTSARFLKRLLTHEGHHVSIVTTPDEVMSSCAATPPDLVLIDLISPHGKGFEVCRWLKNAPTTRLTPVVIVTSQSAPEHRLRGISAGCDDFIGKPFDAIELHARIHS